METRLAQTRIEILFTQHHEVTVWLDFASFQTQNITSTSNLGVQYQMISDDCRVVCKLLFEVIECRLA